MHNDKTMTTIQVNSNRIWQRIETLSKLTEADQPWTRVAFSDLHQQCRQWLKYEMEEIGLVVRVDDGGNMIGTLDGNGTSQGAIASGSHTDTVPRGGRFDGIVGVIAALEIAQTIIENGITLNHPYEVIDFLAEEPNQYGLSCVGSRAIAGELEAWQLDAIAKDGTTLSEGISLMGGSPEKLTQALRLEKETAGFFELHIEQGPVLEKKGLDVGIVTDIVGINRYDITITGKAAHSGTMPMEMRNDALVGAAALITEIHERAKRSQTNEIYLVATVGKLQVVPNGSNVVPGKVEMVLEIRSNKKPAVIEYAAAFHAFAEESIAALNLTFESQLVSDGHPAYCADAIQDSIEQAAKTENASYMHMSSGAGHDAAHMSAVCPSGMIFIPCLDGRSHTPVEWSSEEQVARGTQVMLQAVINFDASHR